MSESPFPPRSHPTREQVEALLEFFESNPGLAKGFSKIPSVRDAARKHWERLTVQLNAMGGCAKSWKQWTKYWADKKSSVRKKAIVHSTAQHKDGDNLEDCFELSEVEKRIIALTGLGQRHFAINVICEPHLPLAETGVQEEHNDSTKAKDSQQGNSVARREGLRSHKEDVNESMDTTADPNCIPIYSDSESSDQEVEILPELNSSLPTPSKEGVHPDHDSSSPTPPRNTNPPRLKAPPSTKSSHRRSHFTRITDRVLRLKEQRLNQNSRNAQLMESAAAIAAKEVDALYAIAKGLESIGEGLKRLAESNGK